MHRALAAAATVAVGITLLAASVASASQPSANKSAANQSSHIRTGSVVRFNVGEPHSPALEHLLSAHTAVAPRATTVSPATLPAGASPLQGIDVASFQHTGGAPINWSGVAAAGYKFAFIKVTEGSYYGNPYYAADAAGAQAAGMLVAPYAFAIPNYSGGALQADYALDHANYAPDGQMLAPVLDIEPDPYDSGLHSDGTNECYGLTQAQMVAWISAFTTEIHRRTSQSPVIYTTSQWWNACTGDSANFSSNPLWIAAPGSSPGTLPTAWANWTYWQNGQATSTAVPAAFDTNYLSSSALELAAPASQSDLAGSSASLGVHSLDGGTTATYSTTPLPTSTPIDTSTGAISGTLPGSAASFPVSVTATDGALQATQSFSWYVHSKASIAAVSSQRGSVATPVRFRVRATDGLSGCTLRFSATGLPRGLSINSCGIISGWPSASRSNTVQVQVTDSSGVQAQASFQWRIARASGSGPSGQIKLNRGGKCLTERSATNIAIETCSSAASEHWTIAPDGTVRMRGQCLAAKKAASSTAPAALALISCTRGQRWQLGSNAVLKNLSDGRCLADTGTRNGVRAVAAVCKAKPNATGSASTPSATQQWTLPAGPLTSGVAGNCASSLRRSSDPVGTVTLRQCRRSAQQSWIIEPDGAISSGGKCLAPAGGRTAPGTPLRLVRCVKGAASQIWQFSGGPIGVQLVSPVAGLCLADPGDSARSGTKLVIGPCVAGDPGISWRVS